MTDYCTPEEVKAQLELTSTTFADGDIVSAVTAASRGIDGYCRRRFWLDPEPVTRLYTPQPPSLFEIDDLVAADTVTLSGTAYVAGTDYLLEPVNAPADGRPYTHVRFLKRIPQPDPSIFGGLPPNPGPLTAALAITGKFGWAEVPEPVHTATKILAAALLIRIRQAPLGIASFGIDANSAMRIAQTDPHVRFLLEDDYRRQQDFRVLQLG